MITDNEFLEKVLDLFIENGAKTLTMDDIAKAFSVSKKTLYEKYKNKEGILEKVLEYKLNQMIVLIKKLNSESSNAIEGMLNKDHCLLKESQENRSVFIRQLMKYYPAVFQQHMLQTSKEIATILSENVEKGRAQGLFRKDFDERAYSKLFFQLMMSYEISPYVDTEKVTKAKYNDQVMMFYLNAITTDKGKKILNNYNNY